MLEQLQELLQGPVGTTLLNILTALGILIVGYLIARIVGNVIRRLLGRTNLDNRIAQAISGGETPPQYDVEDIVGKATFWLIMLFVLVAALQRLGLSRTAAPIDALLQKITTVYLPGLAGAALVLLVAWVVATVLKFLIVRGGALFKLDERLSQNAALSDEEKVSVTEPLATAVFWFIFLFFLPSALNALGLSSLATPIQQVYNDIIGVIPNIVGAAVLFGVGWFIARIVRQIVSNLLAAVGVDKVGERVGLTGERPLSYLVGMLLYAFILLLTLIAALETLSIAAISDPLTNMLNGMINALPAYVGAVAILLVSYYVARFLAKLIEELAVNFGIDGLPAKLGIDWQGTRTFSQMIGYLVILAIMLFAAGWAAELVGSTALFDAINSLIAFVWRLVLAVIIFALGLYLANLAYQTVLSTGGSNARLTANMARLAVLVFVTAMALRQLGVANEIVNMAFGLMLGTLAVAVALAFGLGSRDIAAREVEGFLTNLRGSGEEKEE